MKALKYLTLIFISVCSVLFAQSEGGDAAAGSASSSGGGSAGGGSGIGLAVSSNYVLQSSDVIDVSVYQEEDLSKQVRIEGDGTVSLALIGKVKVAGMTVAESQSLITDLYNRDYIVDPQVSILVISFSPKFVRVLGQVGAPGKIEIPPDRALTIVDAITQCRGATRLGNLKKVMVSRVTESGRIQSFEVNVKKILSGDAQDYELREGDTVFVDEIVI